MENRVDIKEIRTIAGVNLAYWKEKDKEYACCCIVLLDFLTLSVIERKYCVDEITVPYIPGCLAFRELGLVEKTVRTLEQEYTQPDSKAFSYTDIVINEETHGRVLRTHENVKPIFLSIGNMIDLETATEIIKKLVTKESHIPVPTRLADLMTHEIRREWKG